jgi:hypothetical protein
MEKWDANLITDNLWLGCEDAAHAPLDFLQEKGITHILTVGFGLTQIHPSDVLFIAYLSDVFQKITYHKVKAIDIPFYDITKDLPTCLEFIEKAILKGGISRSIQFS